MSKETCHNFVRHGKCRSLQFEGHCHYLHPSAINRENFDDTAVAERCSKCTLPLPCCEHFPSLGEDICDKCEEIKKPVENACLLLGEIVAVIPKHLRDVEVDAQNVYAVVVEDKKAIERVVVKYRYKCDMITVTLRRTYVHKLRQKILGLKMSN